MSFITWTTRAGNLGTVAENEYFEKVLEAADSDGADVFYTFLSGTLPPGVQVTRAGTIQGVPSILLSEPADSNYSYSFAVRASTADGVIADRTFGLTVSTIVPPLLLTPAGKIATIFDGTLYSFQFQAQDTANSVITFSVAEGAIPPGLNLSVDGILSGFPTLIYRGDEFGAFGYDNSRHDTFGYDYAGLTLNKNYTFKIRVSDGLNSDVKQYSLTVLSKAGYTGDNTFVTGDDTFVTVGYDNEYLPIMTTPPGNIGIVRQLDKFNFKFEAYDASFDTVAFAATVTEESGFDFNGDNEFHLTGIGFDTTEFDQGNQRLPDGLALNFLSGWMSGTVGAQAETIRTYSFKITPYKLGRPAVAGQSVTYTLTVLGSEFNTVTWITDPDLGVIDEGKPCTLQLEAVSNISKNITYSLEAGAAQQLPQGVRLTTDGYLIGRPTFRRFSVDADFTIINVADTTGIEVDMNVTGPGVGTGAKVVEVVDDNRIIVAPAVISAAGTALTFINNSRTVILVTVLPNTTTAISDGGVTTFDGIREFTVRATASSLIYDNFTGTGSTTVYTMSQAESAASSVYVTINGIRKTPVIDYDVDITAIIFKTAPAANSKIVVVHNNSISNLRTFNVRLSEYNLAPYENVYIKSFPSLEQRNTIKSILDNTSVFPNDFIYRINDPWFGKSKDIKALILPGLSPSSLSEYALAMVQNHYNKNVFFGEIKSARAVDEFFNTKYEVVYIELVDRQVSRGRPVSKEQIDLSNLITNYFNNDPNYNYLYPNSFNNMSNRLGGVLGFTNRGALPDWMTSPQEDGRVIGFVPAVVLAYTKPGYGNSIKFRLERLGFNFNDVDFTADRYQLDNSLSSYFDTETNKFQSSTETTFDYIPRIGAVIATVNYATNRTFYSINNRHYDYIVDTGGIDGTINFNDGDTLIFAQQENYVGNTIPYHGWIITGDSFNITPFDTVGLEAYTIIPGYLEKLYSFSAQNQRAGIWTIRIDDFDIVTLEFTQEIFVSERVLVGNGTSFRSSILVYDPLIKPGESVPSYTNQTLNNRTSTQRTTFDGNGTKFINYRDIYAAPESGDKYLKFPQIGVFN